ncbi:hypothetical protein A6U87_20445 [Rhizobium sp. AC44/96]|nr:MULTISPECIES: helix-turn-helix transcriptional regulator [unclassified Rhizobium]MDM9621909.1 helix-turn-helix transcriptional regulator [Rhizobium sp. S96]OCJ17189.1 hypothetical protein A6U87_20445 [Rhizobium sp. AC44/96]
MPRINTDSTAEIDEEIGDRLLNIRLARGISQAELGDSLGVSFQQIQKYERGSNRMSASVLVLICKELKVSPMTLLGQFFENDDGAGDADILRRLIEAEDRLRQIRGLCSKASGTEA